MAGIWNINNVYNLNSKRITNTLSFQLGEVFLARLISLDEASEEVLLRLMDGWQFSANLKNPLEFPPSGLIRFQVDGFEEGKLQLVIINDKNSEEKLQQNSIENILKNENIKVNKDEYSILEKMVKHNIQLTKENISEVKTLMNFVNKISQGPMEEENFIKRYVESRGINLDSPEGKKVEGVLKGFFSELKKLDEDSILTLLENNLDLTEDNVKSFNKVFKEPMSVYKSLQNIKELIQINNHENIENKDIIIKSNVSEDVPIGDNKATKELVNKDNGPEKSYSIQSNRETLEGILKEKFVGNDSNKKINNKEELTLKNTEENVEDKLQDNAESKSQDKDVSKQDANIENDKIQKNNTLSKKEIIIKDSITNLSDKVKGEINSKIEDMKNIIKTLIESKDDTNGEAYDNIIQFVKQENNNFKVFNTVSNQYYYMDIPIDVNKGEYECKLIIKDERKKGKKIDSKNVKIATSVRTVNMGVVDAFISVNNSNMNIDIKCNESWIKVLDSGKDRVLNALANTEYNVYVKVEEKKEELDLISCREFFDDNNIGAINIKV